MILQMSMVHRFHLLMQKRQALSKTPLICIMKKLREKKIEESEDRGKYFSDLLWISRHHERKISDASR